jgi:hypothetical protein
MANVKHYKQTGFRDGLQTIALSSWKWFYDYIQKELVDYKSYVFRGQRRAAWPLESTLDRAIQQAGLHPATFDYSKHLTDFKAATRGRRGVSPPVLGENEWWALGQHNGLHTPLLDWTESPFVALYFAFVNPREFPADKRAVWAISRASVEAKTAELNQGVAGQPVQPQGVEIISPLTDDNARLVSQRGLFTRGPNGVPLCKWVETNFKGEPKSCILIKIEIPEHEGDRPACLRFLNRMNINHLTLFPDLYGASKYCTMTLEITSY